MHSLESGVKKIVLVGKEFFAGLKQQYESMANMGLLRKKTDESFKILSEKQEIVHERVKK